MQGDQQQTQESAPVRAGRASGPAIPGSTKKPKYRGQNLTSQELLALRAKGQDYQTSTDDIIDDADEIRRRAYQDQLKEGSTKLDGVKPTREPRAKGGHVERFKGVSTIFDDGLVRLRGAAHSRAKKGSAYIGVNDGAGGSELSLPRHPRAKRGRGRPRKARGAAFTRSVNGGFPFLSLFTTLLPVVLPLVINGVKWVIDKVTGKKKQVAAGSYGLTPRRIGGIPLIPRPIAYENPIWHLYPRPHTTGGISLSELKWQKWRRENPKHIDRRTPGIVDPATLVPDMPSRRIRRTPTGIQASGESDHGFPLTIWDVEGGPVDDEIEGNPPGTERGAIYLVLKQDHETPINALFNLVDYFMTEVIPDANMSTQEVLEGDDGGEEVGYWKSMFANTETSYKALYNIAKEQGLLKSIFQLPKSHVLYRVVDFNRAKGEWVLEDSVPLAPIGAKPLIGSGLSRMPYHLADDRSCSSSRMIPRGGAHPIFDTVPHSIGAEAARIRQEWLNKQTPRFKLTGPPAPPGPFGRGEDDEYEGDDSEVVAALAATKKPASKPLRWNDGYGDLQAIHTAYKNPRKAGERMLKVAGSKEFADATSLEKIRLIVRSELEAIIPKILKSAFNEHEIEEHFDHKQMIEDVLNHVLPKGISKFECDDDSSDDETREGSGVPRGGAIDMKSFIVPLASWATHKTLKEAGMVVDKQAILELAKESAGAIDFYGKGCCGAASGFYGSGDIEMLMDGQGIIDVIKKVRDFAKHIAMDILPKLVGVAASAMKPTIKKVLENTSFGKQHPMLLSLIADVILGIVQALAPASEEEKKKRAKEEKKAKDEEDKKKKKEKDEEDKKKKKEDKKKKGKDTEEQPAPAAAGADTEILDALAAEVGDQKKT